MRQRDASKDFSVEQWHYSNYNMTFPPLQRDFSVLYDPGALHGKYGRQAASVHKLPVWLCDWEVIFYEVLSTV